MVYNIIARYTVDNEDRAQKLGENLKRILTERGMSQGDIVRELDMPRSFVSSIGNGKTPPRLSTITKSAKAHSVSVGELMK